MMPIDRCVSIRVPASNTEALPQVLSRLAPIDEFWVFNLECDPDARCSDIGDLVKVARARHGFVALRANATHIVALARELPNELLPTCFTIAGGSHADIAKAVAAVRDRDCVVELVVHDSDPDAALLRPVWRWWRASEPDPYEAVDEQEGAANRLKIGFEFPIPVRIAEPDGDGELEYWIHGSQAHGTHLNVELARAALGFRSTEREEYEEWIGEVLRSDQPPMDANGIGVNVAFPAWFHWFSDESADLLPPKSREKQKTPALIVAANLALGRMDVVGYMLGGRGPRSDHATTALVRLAT